MLKDYHIVGLISVPNVMMKVGILFGETVQPPGVWSADTCAGGGQVLLLVFTPASGRLHVGMLQLS